MTLELAEQNSSADEQFEASFMGEDQSDLQPENLVAETGTPVAVTSTPSSTISSPEMMNSSPTQNSVPPSPAEFGPPGMNGTPSFATYTRSLQENSAGNGQREQISEPASLVDVPVQQLTPLPR